MQFPFNCFCGIKRSELIADLVGVAVLLIVCMVFLAALAILNP